MQRHTFATALVVLFGCGDDAGQGGNGGDSGTGATGTGGTGTGATGTGAGSTGGTGAGSTGGTGAGSTGGTASGGMGGAAGGAGGVGGSGGGGGTPMGGAGGMVNAGGCAVSNGVPAAVGWTDVVDTGAQDRAHDVVVANGIVYVVGYTNGTLPGMTSFGFDDAFVMKLDSAGNPLFTDQFAFGGARFDNARSVDVRATGEFVVAGHTSFNEPAPSNAPRRDAFLRMYGANEAVNWEIEFGTLYDPNDVIPDGDEYGFDVKFDSVGNAVLVGRASALVEAGGVYYGSSDVYVTKRAAADGAEMWTRQFGTSAAEQGKGVAIDASDNVYVTGYTEGDLEGANAGAADPFLRKYDSGGTLQWTRQFGGPADERAYGLVVDSVGNVIMSGHTQNLVCGDVGYYAFVRKYDPAGNEIWTHQYEGTYGFGLAVDDNDNLAVAGRRGGNPYVTKIAANGNALWTQDLFGGGSSDDAEGVSVDSAGFVYVAGFRGPGGNRDAFIVQAGP